MVQTQMHKTLLTLRTCLCHGNQHWRHNVTIVVMRSQHKRISWKWAQYKGEIYSSSQLNHHHVKKDVNFSTINRKPFHVDVTIPQLTLIPSPCPGFLKQGWLLQSNIINKLTVNICFTHRYKIPLIWRQLLKILLHLSNSLEDDKKDAYT